MNKELYDCIISWRYTAGGLILMVPEGPMWNPGCIQERTAPNMFESSLDLIWGAVRTLKKGDKTTCKPQHLHYPCWTTLINTSGGCKWFVSLEGTDELLYLWHPINLAKGYGRIWISKCELVIMESTGLWSWSVYQVKWHCDFCAFCEITYQPLYSSKGMLRNGCREEAF